MFGLIEMIVALSFTMVMVVGTVAVFHRAEAEPAAAQAQAAIVDAQRDELVQGVLDQAQVLVGASNLYASEHSGTWPTTVRELTEGRYLDSTVIPDTRASRQQYRLVQDGKGFSVQLALDSPAVCQQIANSAMHSGGYHQGTARPYDCETEKGAPVFAFRP